MFSIRTLVFAALSLVPALALANVNVDKTGLAIHGYDPVAYFTQNAAVPGDFQITAEHAGATYRFATKANKAAFEKAPARYAPQFGGYCAYGVSVGARFTADPKVFQIVDGKLYLNLNPAIAQTFNKDLKGSLAKAVAQWPKVAKGK